MKAKGYLLRIALVATMLVGVPVQAADIDLLSLSMEQLIELRDTINVMISENGGDNVIGKGTYVTGNDIAPGYYKIICSQDAQYGFINVEVYPSKEDCDNNVNREVAQIYFNKDNPTASESTATKLEEGNVLRLSGEAIIQEIDPAWAP